MSATNDFSRRFFADFIAMRIKAWHMQEGGSRLARRAGATRAEGEPAKVDRRSSETAPVDLRPRFGSSGV